MYNEAWSTLKHSLFNSDFLIFIVAIVELIFLILTFFTALMISSDWKKGRKNFSKSLCTWSSTIYTLFTTFISIFPLMGMLGTVFGLLGLDIANGDMENIKNNFFIALTSTAWGIIFSVIYKIVYALIADYTEKQIERAKSFLKEIEEEKIEVQK